MSNPPKARVVFGCGNGEVNVTGPLGSPAETLVRIVHTAQNTLTYEVRSSDAMGEITWVPLDAAHETKILRLAFTRALLKLEALESLMGPEQANKYGGKVMVPEPCLPFFAS